MKTRKFNLKKNIGNKVINYKNRVVKIYYAHIYFVFRHIYLGLE